MRGRLYQLGGYPGLVPTSEPDAWVQGEVYVLENPSELLVRLDEYEGCGPDSGKPHEFVRDQREAVLETGESDLVWVYIYKGAIAGRDEILSGDYCRPGGEAAANHQEISRSRR